MGVCSLTSEGQGEMKTIARVLLNYKSRPAINIFSMMCRVSG